MSGRLLSRADLGATRAVKDAGCFIVPLLVTVWCAWHVLSGPDAAIDFHLAYLPAARRLLHGGSPYLWSQARIVDGEAFVYPALAGWVFVPFALLPVGFADGLATVLCIILAPATLALLGVRDRRLLCFVLLWPMVVAGWQTANVTLWLGLGLAGVWRLRDRPWAAGTLAALLIAIKPFTWPIVLWLIATRRVRATVFLLVVELLVNAVAWPLIGRGAISQYVSLSHRVTSALLRGGYGIPAVAGHLGPSITVGTVLTVGLGALCVVCCLRMGRGGAEVAALAATVALMLVASPLVRSHYFALLIVPLALARPRLDVWWTVPLLAWVCPAEHVALWEELVLWTVGAATFGICLRSDGAMPRLTSPSLGPAFRLGTGV